MYKYLTSVRGEFSTAYLHSASFSAGLSGSVGDLGGCNGAGFVLSSPLLYRY